MGLYAFTLPAIAFLLVLIYKGYVKGHHQPSTQQEKAAKVILTSVESNAATQHSADIATDPNRDDQHQSTDSLSSEHDRAQTSASVEVVAPARVPMRDCKVVLQPVKLLSSHFDYSAGFLFDRTPFSALKMAHVVSLSSEDGQPVPAHDVIESDQALISKTFGYDDDIFSFPPSLDFNGSHLLLKAVFEYQLQSTFNAITHNDKLGPYRARITKKGLSFTPFFWHIKGVSTHQSQSQLSAVLQSYVARNANVLGKWRAVWASYDYIPCVYTQYFTGEIIVITEADTVGNPSNRSLPLFQGIRPRRIQNLQDLQKFGPGMW